MVNEIHVLHVNDEPDFADLTADFLEREDDRFTVTAARSADEALAELDQTVDCVVSDYEMPGMDGLELLEEVRERYPELPFVLFTGQGSEAVASEAISTGVTDYLQKGTGSERFTLLANRLENAVEARRASETASERKRRLERIMGAVPSCVVQLDRNGEFVFANDRAKQVLGLERDAVTDRAYNDPEWQIKNLDGEPIPDGDLPFERVLETGEPVEDFVHTIEWPDGSRRVLSVNGAPLLDDGTVERILFSLTDITDRHERERELKQYQELVETMDDVAFIVDREFEVQYVNDRIGDYLSVPPEAMEGQPIELLAMEYTVDPADGEQFLSTLDDVFEGEADTPVRLEIPLDIDERVVFEYQFSPVRERAEAAETETFPAVAVTMRDVTERRERERELEATKERLDTVISNVPVVLFAIDEDGVFTLSEGRGLSKLGLEPGEVVGESVFEFYADQPDILDASERALDGESVEVTVEAGGVHLDTAYQPVTDDDGSVTGAIGVAFDVTERRERERELRRQKQRSQELVSVVSHDLRNPLNVATGRLELADGECDSESLDAVADALARIDDLIDDLLTLAESGGTLEEFGTVDLETVATASWRSVATGSADLVTEKTCRLAADAGQLRRLLENLMRNAVDHVGEDVTVTVGCHDDGFYVADDGPGIPEAAREDVFRYGYSGSGDGTGFGLAIVEEVADAHDWSVTITESDAGGARFEVHGVERAD